MKTETPRRGWPAFLRRALRLAAGLAGALTGYLLLARWFWPAEVLCHFRPFLALLWLGLAGVALLARARGAAAGFALAALASAWPTLALLVPRERPEPTGTTLRVASANLLWGTDTVRDLLSWVDEVRPDLLFVSEIAVADRAALGELRARGFEHVLLCPPEAEWTDATWGRILLARRPLRRGATRWPGPILDAWIELDGRAVRVLGAHPMRPGRAELTSRRNRVLAHLAALAAEQPGAIVLGDLNLTECSPRYDDLLADGRLADTRAGRGRMGTWKLFNPHLDLEIPWIRLPLDHVLAGSGLVSTARSVGRDFGSDHAPVLADVGWRP